jgi:hypothetical protein
VDNAGVDGTAGVEAKRRRRPGLALTAAIVIALAFAGAARARTINVDRLAQALQDNPVQVNGHARISPGQVQALRRQIAQRDPGRIWIAVVSDLSPNQTGELAQDLADTLLANGVVIVASGSNYHVTTSWGSGRAARQRLTQAVDRPGDSLDVQMQRAIDGFATADAAAGHPGSFSGATGTQTQTSPSTSGTSTGAQTPPSTPATTTSGGGGGSGGLVAGLIVLVIVVGLGTASGVRYMRRSIRTSHRRKEQAADVQAQAQADFGKLGDEIGALDIDSSMPNASAQGKDEYAKALDCYQDAEKRLAKSNDGYQFERAQAAVRQGLEHVHAAERLFNPASDPPPPSADVVAELSKLAALRDRGALTPAEFAAEKKRLLGE